MDFWSSRWEALRGTFCWQRGFLTGYSTDMWWVEIMLSWADVAPYKWDRMDGWLELWVRLYPEYLLELMIVIARVDCCNFFCIYPLIVNWDNKYQKTNIKISWVWYHISYEFNIYFQRSWLPPCLMPMEAPPSPALVTSSTTSMNR